jgi:uncharacterized repeat protein (TIGR03803 family)
LGTKQVQNVAQVWRQDGASPFSSLIFDQAGNLYGTTENGGDFDWGTVFQLTPHSDGKWTERVLYSFTEGNDGARPFSNLILDQAGNLYGTTAIGGNSTCLGGGCGVVFQLSPNQDGSWTESVLYAFKGGADGGEPFGGLTFDQAGNLYGTTTGQGTSSWGTVFSLAHNQDGSWTEAVLHHFAFDTGGAVPGEGLTFDQAGALYGTTVYAGDPSCQCGVVFKLSPNQGRTWTESVLYAFKGGADGGEPNGYLTFDRVGKLYGTTQNFTLSSKVGVAFQLTPQRDGNWTEKVLHQFTGGNDGFQPGAGLMWDQAGNLYGTTSHGGGTSRLCSTGCGVVFKLSPKSKGEWNETVLHQFHSQPGAFPVAGVIFDPAGNLYGTTSGKRDSAQTLGSVFEITP